MMSNKNNKNNSKTKSTNKKIMNNNNLNYISSTLKNSKITNDNLNNNKYTNLTNAEILMNNTNNAIKTTTNQIKKGMDYTQETLKNIKDKGDDTIKNIDKTLKATFKLPTMENKLEMISSKNNKDDIKKNEINNNKKIKKIEKESIDTMYKGNMFSKIIGVLILVTLLIALIYAGSEYYKYQYLNITDDNKIMIFEGIHDGSTRKLISQDPKYKTSVAINKSDNRPGGMEFTYSFWIMINGTKNKQQHIFHKGDKNEINKTPGVYLEANKNTMIFYLNTSKAKTGEKHNTIDALYETLTIENLPLKKWINVTITFVEGKKDNQSLSNNISIYINGLLKKSQYLQSTPVLNEHDLHISKNGGFKGFLANMYYYPKLIEKEEIFKLVDACPKEIGCGIEADCPPYLDNNWWFN